MGAKTPTARSRNRRAVVQTRKAATGARKSSRKTAGKTSKRRQSRPTDPEVVEWAAKNVASLRELLRRNVLNPLHLVMLTRERIQEVADDAVERGRMTRMDANDFVQGLLRRGRKETDDVLSDLERILGRGRDQLDGATGTTRERATQAAITARKRVERTTAGSRVARSGSRSRKRSPIARYDQLSAADVRKRLGRLSPTELRQVRQTERRGAARKSVLEAIDKKLG